MFKTWTQVLVIGCLSVSGYAASLHAATDPLPLTAQQVSEMIAAADDYRLQQSASKVVSHVSLYKDEQLDKSRIYHVYTRPNRESLVVFKSAVEAGQKMLMLQDNYWLQMPKSRRPIRITPMQKLLGEASVGDISTLTWSQDYQGEWLRTEAVPVANGDPAQEPAHKDAHVLRLNATHQGASYQKIDLWLSKEDAFPIKADLYLASGKLAKQAWFMRGALNGRAAVTQMTLLDSIQPAKKTVIDYSTIQAWTLDDKFFTPAFLSRVNTTEL